MPARPSGPLPSGGAHRHRLGLVVGMMRHQQMKDTARPTGLEQQAIACRARGLLKAYASAWRRSSAGPGVRCRDGRADLLGRGRPRQMPSARNP